MLSYFQFILFERNEKISGDSELIEKNRHIKKRWVKTKI